MAAKLATTVGDVTGPQQYQLTLKMYLILLRRSKAFHWRQSRFEILQPQKLRGGVPPIPPGSITPPPPPPTLLYHGGGMNLRVCPRNKINENKNETSRYSGPCQEYAFRRQTLTFWAIFKQRKTKSPAREEAFCALLPVCHFGSLQSTPGSGNDPFLKKMCCLALALAPVFTLFLDFSFFPVLFLRALPCCTSWTTGKGCRFAINRSSYITFNEWKQVDSKVTCETLNNFKVVWWTYFICRKDRM